MIISFLFMVPAIIYGEKKARLKEVFIASVALMLAAQLAFITAIQYFWGIFIALSVYFVAFNILEASLPSIISKIAPAGSKGTAIGVYNTFQSLGFFVGGAMGGLLSSYFGASAVFMFGAGLIGVWLVLAFRMKPLPAVKNLIFPVRELSAAEARRLEERLAGVRGVTEAKVIAEENTAYLKVDGRRLDEPALRALLPST
jgi:MFS family permease